MHVVVLHVHVVGGGSIVKVVSRRGTTREVTLNWHEDGNEQGRDRDETVLGRWRAGKNH